MHPDKVESPRGPTDRPPTHLLTNLSIRLRAVVRQSTSPCVHPATQQAFALPSGRTTGPPTLSAARSYAAHRAREDPPSVTMEIPVVWQLGRNPRPHLSRTNCPPS